MNVDRKIKGRLRFAVETARDGEQLGRVLRAVRVGRRACNLSQRIVVVHWWGSKSAMMRRQRVERRREQDNGK